jgi:hypothetical protein
MYVLSAVKHINGCKMWLFVFAALQGFKGCYTARKKKQEE